MVGTDGVRPGMTLVELEEVRSRVRWMRDAGYYTPMINTVDVLLQEVVLLREALGYYAQPGIYECGDREKAPDVCADGGRWARDALRENE